MFHLAAYIREIDAVERGWHEAYTNGEAENRRRVPHRVCHLVRAHIVGLDHMIQTSREQPTGVGVEREGSDSLLVIGKCAHASASSDKIPHSENRSGG